VSTLDAAREEVERAQQRLEEARGELERAVRAAGGGPARDAAHAEDQARRLREAIGRDVDALRDRALETVARVDRARTTAAVVAAGVAALGVTAASVRRGTARRHLQRSLQEQARTLALELARLDSSATERSTRASSGGASAALVVIGAAAVVGTVGAIVRRRRTALQADDLWLPEA
jgi:cobalamin biosynthesis Mg chelatase CobN